MFDFQVIDIGVGLMLLYLVLSLACTAATEMLAGIVRLRAKTLEEGIGNLLRDPGMKESILKHPLIRDLHREGKKPSYIPPRSFALSLINILSNGEGLAAADELRANLRKLPETSGLRTSLLVLMDEAGDDLKNIQKSIETWYNDTMDRVGGWYKTRTQIVTVVVALVIVVLANADTIQWTKSLANDPALREALVAQAQEYAKRENATGTVLKDETATGEGVGNVVSQQKTSGAVDSVAMAAKKIEQNVDALKALGVPLGWKSLPADTGEWITKILGLLLTTLALSLGAPFWFDVLKRVVNVRASGVPAGAKEEKKTA